MKKEKSNWPVLIEDWQRSGLSQAAFCKANDIALSTFQYYRYKEKKALKRHSGFSEIRIDTPAPELLQFSLDASGKITLKLNLHFNVRL